MWELLKQLNVDFVCCAWWTAVLSHELVEVVLKVLASKAITVWNEGVACR